MVIKDLIDADGTRAELIETKKILKLQEDKILLYKQKDTLKDQKIANLETIIFMKDEQMGLHKQKSNDLLKELKQQRRKTFLYKVGTVGGIIMTGMFLLK